MHRHSGTRNHTDDGHEHPFLNDTDITSIDSESENIEPVSSDANLITRTLFSSNADANAAATTVPIKNINSIEAQSRVLFPADEGAQVIVKLDATNVATSTSTSTSNVASMSHDKGLDISQESSETFIMEANDDTSIDESVVSYGSGSGSGSADANSNTQTPCKFKLNLAFGACINTSTGHSDHSQASSRKRTSSDRTATARIDTTKQTSPQGLFKAGGFSPESRTHYNDNDNDNDNTNNSSEAARFHFDSPVRDAETSARGSPDNFSMKFSEEWLGGSTSAYKASMNLKMNLNLNMKEGSKLGSILSTCQVTRSPIDECMPKFHGDHGSNYYTDLDTSMEEEDDSYAVTKFRRLNLNDDVKDCGPFRSNGQQQKQPIRMPMGVVPRTVKKAHFPNESTVDPFQLFTSPQENAGQVALGHEKSGVGAGSFISPNDVMEQIGILQNPTHKNPSHPTIDFESDMFSPPAPMKNKLTERKSPNGSPFAAPSNASYNYYQNNSIGEMNAPMSSFYGNYNLRTSISTTAQPKTPMLERKPPRSRMNFSPPSPEGPKEISRFEQDFDIIGTLGSGYFGTVYKCLSRLDGCTYAIKAAKHRAKGDSERTRMLQEVKALAELSDVSDMAAFHIVRYHQAWIEDDRLHIVTDLCHSTLQVEMSKGYLRHEARQYKLLREMLLALKLIHQHGKVHLDIKPENIFLKDDKFKLGDFGLVVEESTVGEVQEGDSRYMCKDLLSGNHRDLTKCDIFSLGITMYEIVVNRPLPLDGQEWQDLRAGRLGPLPGTPPELQKIIRQMMHEDAKNRPTAAELLTRRQLLSEEQKKLIIEQNKAKEAKEALEANLRKLTPPRRMLQRANTCPDMGTSGGNR